MTVQGWFQILLYVAVLTALTPLIGAYMYRVYTGETVLLSRIFGPIERLSYRLLRTGPEVEQDWKAYARTTLIFSAFFFVLLYVILRAQGSLPFNPDGFGGAPPNVTFNTATSFVTNTNWQFYGGETTMSYLSQMAGLAVQNFVSAAVGMAVLVAVIRGFIARSGRSLGNFWVDLIRSLLYILVPISVIGGLFLISQGVLQTLDGSQTFQTLTGGSQTLALGPVGSQEAIKELGTNGGGFFNVNSAMPFENPSGLTNFVEMVLILLIPAGLTATFGRMAGNKRLGWAIYGAMAAMFIVGVGIVYAAETSGSTAQHLAHVAGSNLEGKEVRFGDASSALGVVITTVASCGAVNAAHEALTAIGGGVPIANMATGEVIFGGVGSGLYGMLLFILLAVFIAGLMVGRTPEFLGKKIEAREIKLVVLGTIAVPLLALIATAVSIATDAGRESIYNAGPQGFSETLYAYVSQANNNGSAFAGFTGFLQPNAPGNVGATGVGFADFVGGFAMLVGRFAPMILALAVAGSLAGKRVAPAGPGTMRTDTVTFVVLLVGTILLVALLTFVPALLLGPVVQALTEQVF